MDEPIHIAITMHVRETHVAEFERALTDFACRSLAEPGARGVLCLYPPPGSASTEYCIMRSFAGSADRDAFFATTLFEDWLDRIDPMIEDAAAIARARSLVPRSDGAHAVSLENGRADVDRGVAGQHVRVGYCCTGAGTGHSSSPPGSTRCGRPRHRPHVGRHAFPRQDRAPLAAPQELSRCKMRNGYVVCRNRRVVPAGISLASSQNIFCLRHLLRDFRAFRT
jgi:quinol monooxygenase YgiN